MKNPILVVSLALFLCFAFQKNETTGIVDVEGAKLHYIIGGNGVPCLVLGHPIVYPRTFSKSLRQNIKFIFLGLRHDAQSENSMETGKIMLETYMKDIEHARHTLGLDKIAVLGHSGHGMMALEYARKYPQNTSHVIMIGTPPLMNEVYRKAMDEYWEKQASDERKMILKRNLEQLPKDKLDSMTPSRRYISTYLAYTPRIWYNPNYDFTWGFEGYEYDMDVLNRVWGEVLAAYNIAAVSGEIKTPVFLAMGKHDYVAPHYLWDGCREKWPSLTFFFFEKSGHWPMLEEQELFDKKLVEWIKTLKRGAE